MTDSNLETMFPLVGLELHYYEDIGQELFDSHRGLNDQRDSDLGRFAAMLLEVLDDPTDLFLAREPFLAGRIRRLAAALEAAAKERE